MRTSTIITQTNILPRVVIGFAEFMAGNPTGRSSTRPGPDPALPMGRAFDLAGTVLKDDHADRPLTDDVAQAAEMLDSFARLA
jgi:hypothetical protein